MMICWWIANKWEIKQNVRMCHVASKSGTIWVRRKTQQKFAEISLQELKHTGQHKRQDLPLCISMHREGPAAHINEFANSMKTKDQHTSQTCSYIFRVSFLSMRLSRRHDLGRDTIWAAPNIFDQTYNSLHHLNVQDL
jgi:hypothetical protein